VRYLKRLVLVLLILGITTACSDVPFASAGRKVPGATPGVLVAFRPVLVRAHHKSRPVEHHHHHKPRPVAPPLTQYQRDLMYLRDIQIFYAQWELNYISPLAQSYPWDRIATCETSGNFGLAGSEYSTAYGILDQAVWENAPHDVALLILSGKSQPIVQLKLAERIATRFGITAWAGGTLRCSGVT